MLTQKSLQPLIWTYNFGSWLNILPYYWNKNEGRLLLVKGEPGLKNKYKFWKVFAVINICGRIGEIVLTFILMRFGPNLQSEEIIFLMFGASVALLAASIHILYFCCGPRLVIHMNTLLQVNQDSGTELKLRIVF